MENENKQDVIDVTATPTPSTPLIIEESGAMLSQDFVDSAARQIEIRSKLLCTALKAVKPHDFQDFDGKPYLEGEGAARIMAVIRGFKVGEALFKIETIHQHFFIECNIPIEFYGATTVAIGDCSTADPFFTGREGNGGQYKKHVERTGSETMAARLILGDAKKKARENALSRGVSELLGLKGLSWDDLAQLGFSRSGAGSSVAFKKGSQGGAIETVAPSALAGFAVGSRVNVKGVFIKSGLKTAGDKKLRIVEIKDATTTVMIQRWGEEDISAFEGQEVFCENVGISEYRGNRQYTASKIDITEVPENDNAK